MPASPKIFLYAILKFFQRTERLGEFWMFHGQPSEPSLVARSDRFRAGVTVTRIADEWPLHVVKPVFARFHGQFSLRSPATT
jgi:hypothetical protein